MQLFFKVMGVLDFIEINIVLIGSFDKNATTFFWSLFCMESNIATQDPIYHHHQNQPFSKL
jgi:hypothetical protein